MRKLKRRTTSLALGLAAGLLLLPAASQAATTFGSRLNHDPANSGECESLGPCTIVSFIHPSDPNGDPYAGGAPSDGVITKFRIRAYAPEASQVTFRVADITRPDPNDQTSALATAAGTGPTVTIQPTEASEIPIVEVDGRLPVKKGQHLAIDASPKVQATVNDSGAKFSYVFAPPLVAGSGARRGSTEVTGELLVAATLEPDADGDGFGDETQDRCPSQASTQAECDKQAPSISGLGVSGDSISFKLSEAATVKFTLAKKVPGRKVGRKCVRPTTKNQSKKRCARFKTIGASFGGTARAGANKFKLPNGKNLGPGTYRLTLTATDVAGNKSTKTTTFKVAKTKKR